MECGNFISLTYDPLLFLIKNIILILFLLAYFIEKKINQKNIYIEKEKDTNGKIEEEESLRTCNNDEDDLRIIESIVLSNKLYEKKINFFL